MYRKKDKSKQTQMQMVCIEDLVPQEHLLRDIESAMDWTFNYDEGGGVVESGHRPRGAVQNRVYPISVRHPEYAADNP